MRAPSGKHRGVGACTRSHDIGHAAARGSRHGAGLEAARQRLRLGEVEAASRQRHSR